MDEADYVCSRFAVRVGTELYSCLQQQSAAEAASYQVQGWIQSFQLLCVIPITQPFHFSPFRYHFCS